VSKRHLFLREPAEMALAALRAHKLRSFLTLLGVIISVTTLIGVISVIEGMNRYIAERVANLGANIFLVTRFPIITNAKEYLEAQRRNKKITWEDYEYLRERLSLAEEVGAIGWTRKDVRAGREELEEVSVRGITPNGLAVSTEKVAYGRYLTPGDYERRALVAFIGQDIVDRLFSQVDPLGKTVWIDALPFEVVGVAEKAGTVFGQSQDNFVYVPLTTFRKLWGEGPGEDGLYIAVKGAGPDFIEQTKDQVRSLMRARRHLRYDEKDNFGIIASESINDLWKQLTGGIAAAAVGITSVFLVVGGIVIMNIMLASVTERTHEIGIRKSLGARRRDILLQFLVEASVLATIGGVLGVVLALGLTQLVAATTPVPMHTPLSAVVLAVAVSTAVGLFFGIYPARKAARLDPVVALRAE